MTEHEAEQLPAAEPKEHTGVAVPAEATGTEVALPQAPSRFRDVASDLQCAAQAVRYVEVTGVQADISTTLQTAVVTTGSTPAQALQAAASFARESPMVEIHSIAWARVPGPVRDLDEFRATLIVSYPDGEGEYTGTTDHAKRAPSS